MPRYRATAEGSFADAMADIVNRLSKISMDTAREVSLGIKADLRAQIVQAGLGNRLANTWRGKVFPERQSSLDPAAFVYSKAPDIIDAFDRGVTIVPVNGSKYLAIPTKNVPYRGRGKRMTPADVEDAFNQDLKFGRTSAGRIFAFIEAIQSRNQKAWRRATKGRLKQGRQAKIVVMFFLIPAAHLPKSLDLDAVAESWAAKAQALFEQKTENL